MGARRTMKIILKFLDILTVITNYSIREYLRIKRNFLRFKGRGTWQNFFYIMLIEW